MLERVIDFTNLPLAVAPYLSYRYKGQYGWIMIGALDDTDAMREVRRSVGERVLISNEFLEKWNGTKYMPTSSR